MKERALELLYGPRAIDRAVRGIAGAIDRDYRGKSLVMVGVLKGSFVFLSDLVRRLAVPVTIDFARTSSYGKGTRSGSMRLLQDVESPLRDREVLIVDDIVDTGRTTRYLLQRLKKRGPSSCRVCALLDKPTRREVEVPVDYCGFVVPDTFIVGYGLDVDERFRQLPGLYILAPMQRP